MVNKMINHTVDIKFELASYETNDDFRRKYVDALLKHINRIMWMDHYELEDLRAWCETTEPNSKVTKGTPDPIS